jgi:hypothetical protein
MAITVPTFADQPALQSAAQENGARFTLLGDEYNREAVRDNKTGLIWERSPALEMSNWEMAHQRCASNLAGGGKDWRVPTVQELSTLVERSSMDVKLPADHPFANVEPAIYWSATERRDDAAYASFVNFSSGRSATLEKFMPTFVWCVRGGLKGQ